MADNFTGSTAQLGVAIGEQANMPVNRDAVRIMEGAVRRADREAAIKKKNAEEKLVGLKDFKFTDGLLPAFAGKEARLYSNYANKLNDAINKYGVANAVNLLSSERSILSQEIKNNKTANDSWINLIESKKLGKIVPGLDEGSDVVLNKDAFDNPENFTKLNNDILGVRVAPNGFVITNVYDDPEKTLNSTAERFNDNRSFNPNDADPNNRVGRVISEYQKGNDLVQQQWWDHPQANKDFMSNMILADKNVRVPLLETHKSLLNSAFGKERYPNIFSTNEELRNADMKKFAEDLTNQKLVGKQIEKSYPIYHQPQGGEGERNPTYDVIADYSTDSKGNETIALNPKGSVYPVGYKYSVPQKDANGVELKLPNGEPKTTGMTTNGIAVGIKKEKDGKQVIIVAIPSEGYQQAYIEGRSLEPYLKRTIEVPYSPENAVNLKSQTGTDLFEVRKEANKKAGFKTVEEITKAQPGVVGKLYGSQYKPNTPKRAEGQQTVKEEKSSEESNGSGKKKWSNRAIKVK